MECDFTETNITQYFDPENTFFAQQISNPIGYLMDNYHNLLFFPLSKISLDLFIGPV
jgi:hypothetical protein